ncbi:hypothetical protein [Halomicronema hongdechloris]|nr:hypothetical protein [Halomicronema hongdechloris]
MLQKVNGDRIGVISRSQAALVDYSWCCSARQHVQHYHELLMEST